MRTTYWTLLLLAGCGFDGGRGTLPDENAGPDAAPDAKPDAPPIDQSGVDFLPTAEETFGDTDWTVNTDTVLDTTTLTITPPQPAGVTLLEGTQHDGTSKVAILRVKNFKINANRTLTARGSRPLFILSDNDVHIDGLLDVGAHGNLPGPGGSSAGMGPGAGAASQHDNNNGNFHDSGGGGGSFGTAGSPGGKAGITNSAAGTPYDIGNNLPGGASGGTAGLCTNPPGAGGGALLIFAKNKINVPTNGAITSGGGGGAGGLDANCGPSAGAGAGGGSGGTIWLQTPKDLDGAGVLAANGGGGGGGSYINLRNGGPGEDGKPSLTAVAAGGTRGNNTGATAGGNGASEGTLPSLVPPMNDGNGGGGGGGLGRIVYRAKTVAGSMMSSPTWVTAP